LHPEDQVKNQTQTTAHQNFMVTPRPALPIRADSVQSNTLFRGYMSITKTG
jgi:hypothetical protein